MTPQRCDICLICYGLPKFKNRGSDVSPQAASPGVAKGWAESLLTPRTRSSQRFVSGFLGALRVTLVVKPTQ